MIFAPDRISFSANRPRRTPCPPPDGRPRFTLDGDLALENRLAEICRQVRERLGKIVPRRRLEAIMLGGGYGRGEGGVLRTVAGDRPYNDLEFYVFVRGHPRLNERTYGAALHAVAEELTAAAGVDVEFKLDSLARLRRSPVTMFTYDLAMGHRWVLGTEELLAGCAHHRRAADIPLHEATRLLLNRCTGLLLAHERLQRPVLTADEADFVTRNLAKARLALGDVLLAAVGRYHWSCRERGRLIAEDEAADLAVWPWFPAVREQHRRGVEFKLRPERSLATAAQLRAEWETVSLLARHLWLWIEGRRLQRRFRRPREYALCAADKCPETSRLRNFALNLWRRGLRALWACGATRYPRERLLRTLPLLLWEPAALSQSVLLRHLRRELDSTAEAFSGFVSDYTRLWARYR
ncbi:MAG: hypothetical protein HY302_08650 [Opitutae bacterium]|nr:hypothetical protein [Opitutae bacterium]